MISQKFGGFRMHLLLSRIAQVAEYLIQQFRWQVQDVRAASGTRSGVPCMGPPQLSLSGHLRRSKHLQIRSAHSDSASGDRFHSRLPVVTQDPGLNSAAFFCMTHPRWPPKPRNSRMEVPHRL